MIIHDIEDSVIAALKQRAKRHQRSLQAELQDILRRAVEATPVSSTHRKIGVRGANAKPRGARTRE